MSNYNLKIVDYEYLIESNDFDIIFDEKISDDKSYICNSIVFVNFSNKKVSIKLNLLDLGMIYDWDFLFVEHNNFLFFRNTNEWVVFDLNKKNIHKREKAFCLPCFEKKQDVIIVFDELDAKCVDFYGNLINEVPIDLPYELEEFEDRIEFESPVFGKQTLFYKK